MGHARALAILLACLTAGCVGGGAGAQNPNLNAPKLVVQPRDDGNVTLFVHGAFGDHFYDWIALDVDNLTLDNRSDAFSLERSVPAGGFFVEARAELADQEYEVRMRVDVDEATERVLVSQFDERTGFGAPRAYGWPYEQVLDRPKVAR